jgi:hypothetical protein
MIAIKPIVPVKAVLASRKQIVARRVSHVVRAEGSSSNETEAKAEGNAESTVFYAGKNYTQAEVSVSNPLVEMSRMRSRASPPSHLSPFLP